MAAPRSPCGRGRGQPIGRWAWTMHRRMSTIGRGRVRAACATNRREPRRPDRHGPNRRRAALLGLRSGAMPQIGGLVGALAGGVVAVLALPWFEDSCRDWTPRCRPLIVLVGLLLAVGLGEIHRVGVRARRSPARSGRRAGRRRPDRRRHHWDGPGAARHLADRQHRGHRARAAAGRTGQLVDGRPGPDGRPAARHRGRRRVRGPARLDRTARRLRRLRAAAGTRGGPTERSDRRAPSPPMPSKARSRCRRRRAASGRSAPGSSSPPATS